MTVNIATVALEEALRAISFAWSDGHSQLVSLPVQYPSGALCTLEVNGGKHEAYVSDRGAGFHEAWTLCEDTCFSRIATQEAKRRGIAYANGTFRAQKVSFDQLPAALVLVSNASVCAAREAMRSDFERKDEVQKDIIFDKVRFAFPSAKVHREIEIAGSRASWVTHNVVDLNDNRKAIFEPVKSSIVSISTKFTMFSDLSSRDDLALTAVVVNPAQLDPKAQLLKSVANIIGIDDTPAHYQMLVQ